MSSAACSASELRWHGSGGTGSKTSSLFLRTSPHFALVPELQPVASEAVFDKLGMSAFVGTPLDIVLRDCGINAPAVMGAVLEIGIEPTVRHATDLGNVRVVVADACGVVDPSAGARSLASLEYATMSLQADADAFTSILARR